MSTRSMRTLRGVLLVLALAAAIAVFVAGRRDDDPSWELPSLILIGVVVLVIHAVTSPDRATIASVPTVVAHGPTYEDLHHHANPHHAPDPTAAEHGGAVGAVPTTSVHVGMADVVVPASSFPDAGHGHGPVISVSDDAPPPPLHALLQPPSIAPEPAAPSAPPAAAPAPPPPPDPSTMLAGPDGAAVAPVTAAPMTPPPLDPVLLDLRPETEDPMVMRVIAGEPPPPGSRADVTSPDVSSSGIFPWETSPTGEVSAESPPPPPPTTPSEPPQWGAPPAPPTG